MPRKSNLSRITRNAKRARLLRAQETDEERSARQAAVRERKRQVYKIKKNNIQEISTEQVRIVNVRTLRYNTDNRGSEKDWLAAVKARMHSEKAWLNSIKDKLNSDKGSLSMKGRNVKNGLHFKPQNYVKGTLNCEMDQLSSEKDLSNSEKDLSNSERDLSNSERDPLNSERDPLNSERDPFNSERDPFNSERDPFNSERDPFNSERDPLNSVGDRLNSNPNLTGNAQPAQYIETYEVTIKSEVFDD